MSKLKTVNFDQFTLKKAKISDTSVECDFEEKRVIDGTAQVIEHNVKAKYLPHPDLTRLRDTLREYLINAYHLNTGHEIAIKYLKGEQKQKAEESLMDVYDKIEVTGISIGGDEQLRGVVISGKIESNNKSKCAMNTPRIVFSSEKLGYELDVEGQIELIEKEIYKYLFEGKKAQKELFDDSNEQGDIPAVKDIPVVDAKEIPVPSGLV